MSLQLRHGLRARYWIAYQANDQAHLCGSVGPVLLLLQPLYLMGKEHILQQSNEPH